MRNRGERSQELEVHGPLVIGKLLAYFWDIIMLLFAVAADICDISEALLYLERPDTGELLWKGQ